MAGEGRSLCVGKRESIDEGKCQVLEWVGAQKSRMEKSVGPSKVHCNLRPEVLEGLGCSRRREGAEGRGAPGQTRRHPGICRADLWEAPKPEDCIRHGEAAAEAKMRKAFQSTQCCPE